MRDQTAILIRLQVDAAELHGGLRLYSGGWRAFVHIAGQVCSTPKSWSMIIVPAFSTMARPPVRANSADNQEGGLAQEKAIESLSSDMALFSTRLAKGVPFGRGRAIGTSMQNACQRHEVLQLCLSRTPLQGKGLHSSVQERCACHQDRDSEGFICCFRAVHNYNPHKLGRRGSKSQGTDSQDAERQTKCWIQQQRPGLHSLFVSVGGDDLQT